MTEHHTRLAEGLAALGVDAKDDPVTAALDAIGMRGAELERVYEDHDQAVRDRDGARAALRALADRAVPPGTSVAMETRDSAVAYASRLLTGTLTDHANANAVRAAGDAVLALALRFEEFVNSGEVTDV